MVEKIKGKLIYCNAYNSNFGDVLGTFIVDKLLKHKSLKLNVCKDASGRGKSVKDIICLGSIMHYTRENDIIWGTGVNPFRLENRKKYPKSLDIRAVRRALTEDYIREKMKLSCPNVYGDPALLLPTLLPRKRNPIRKVGVIPHHSDIPLVKYISQDYILPSADWKDVLDFILGCELVISSSLHGLIVAEAYGIPASWWHNDKLPSKLTEGTFKYNDYLTSTGRSKNMWSGTIEEAINKKGLPPIEYDIKQLLNSFPADSFE